MNREILVGGSMMKKCIFTFGFISVLISLIFSCSTIKLNKDIKIDNSNINEFHIEPSYVVSPIRVDIIRNTSASSNTTSTTNSSTGQTTKSTSYSIKEEPYNELCVSLGNGMYIDINNNLFMDYEYWQNLKEIVKYEAESKQYKVSKNGKSIMIVKKGLFGSTNNYEVDNQNILKIGTNSSNFIIGKDSNGYRKDTYNSLNIVAYKTYIEQIDSQRI